MNKRIPVGLRLLSMLIDHAIMTLIIVILVAPFVWKEYNSGVVSFNSSSGLMALLGMLLYFGKDSFGGRSLAKRLLKLKVVDNNSGETANLIKCFVRNIFCVIWPVEIIITLNTPNRRIGDFVAGTRVVMNE